MASGYYHGPAAPGLLVPLRSTATELGTGFILLPSGTNTAHTYDLHI